MYVKTTLKMHLSQSCPLEESVSSRVKILLQTETVQEKVKRAHGYPSEKNE